MCKYERIKKKANIKVNRYLGQSKVTVLGHKVNSFGRNGKASWQGMYMWKPYL